MRRISLAVALVATLAPALVVTPSAGAAASAPRGFFGIVPQGPLAAADFDRMRGVVGTLRIPIYWPAAEPQRGDLELAATDSIVAAAAAAGVRVLPFVYGTPSWLERDPARPPLSGGERAAWSQFLVTLVHRYGPRGTLWNGTSPRLPIRSWQIWNEPNFLLFWRPRPSPGGYVRLLRASGRAIHGADRGARIVAAGLAPVEGGMLPWVFLKALYSVPGAGRSFDQAAVHPYSATLGGVVYQVREARRVMAEAGDGGKPLLISELGIASDSLLPTSFNKGLRGQAEFLRKAYGLLLGNRGRWHIAGVDWYAWRDMTAADAHCVFCEFAGLFDSTGRAKPAWHVFSNLARR